MSSSSSRSCARTKRSCSAGSSLARPPQAPSLPPLPPAPRHWCGRLWRLVQHPPRAARAWRQPRHQRLPPLRGSQPPQPVRRQQRQPLSAQTASQQCNARGMQRHGSGRPRHGMQHTRRWRRPGRRAPTRQLCKRPRQRWRRRAHSRCNGRPGAAADARACSNRSAVCLVACPRCPLLWYQVVFSECKQT